MMSPWFSATTPITTTAMVYARKITRQKTSVQQRCETFLKGSVSPSAVGGRGWMPKRQKKKWEHRANGRGGATAEPGILK